MNFDILSDIHFDLWLSNKKGHKLKEFVNKLLPDEFSDTLLIAGDLGHNNEQNFNGIKYLKERYKHIVIVGGNHDLWLIDSTTKRTYNWDSFNRLQKTKEELNSIDGVHFLDGDFVNIDGFIIGGTIGYCDGKFAEAKFGMDDTAVKKLYNSFSDSRYIFGANGNMFDFIEYHKKEMERLEFLADFCDIVLTHHIPIWEKMRQCFSSSAYSTFFHFDGYDLLKRFKGKAWIYGHTHDKYEYEYENVKMICNPLGYENENFFGKWESFNKFPRRITKYEIK